MWTNRHRSLVLTSSDSLYTEGKWAVVFSLCTGVFRKIRNNSVSAPQQCSMNKKIARRVFQHIQVKKQIFSILLYKQNQNCVTYHRIEVLLVFHPVSFFPTKQFEFSNIQINFATLVLVQIINTNQIYIDLDGNRKGINCPQVFHLNSPYFLIVKSQHPTVSFFSAKTFQIFNYVSITS